MSYRTMRNWPPLWIEKYADNETLSGELGVLTHVANRSKESHRCYLHITYNEKPYIGSLLFDDIVFGSFVRTLLRKHIAETIEEIGDLDI